MSPAAVAVAVAQVTVAGGFARAWASLAAGDSVNVSILTQYGVLGIFAAMLVAFARISYKRETDRADRLEADNKGLNETIQERVIPALLSATRAIEESGELLNAMQREREVTQSSRRAHREAP